MTSSPATSTIETITPRRAQELLDHMHPSRQRRQREVNRLIAGIFAGTLTAEERQITVDQEGRLLAGQHILAAVAETVTPVIIDINVAAPPYPEASELDSAAWYRQLRLVTICLTLAADQEWTTHERTFSDWDALVREALQYVGTRIFDPVPTKAEFDRLRDMTIASIFTTPERLGLPSED